MISHATAASGATRQTRTRQRQALVRQEMRRLSQSSFVLADQTPPIGHLSGALPQFRATIRELSRRRAFLLSEKATMTEPPSGSHAQGG